MNALPGVVVSTRAWFTQLGHEAARQEGVLISGWLRGVSRDMTHSHKLVGGGL